MTWLALDIGGANVKVADGKGFAQSYSFALWRDSSLLAQQIRTAITEMPPCDHLAVTMTGELADCFESKEVGVRFILKALGEGADNRHVRVYLVDGRLVSPQVALTMPNLAAASNWHALACFVGRYAPTDSALLIDVGSTTCDVIPLLNGKPIAKGITDTQRLIAGELVYTGIERSPVCAVVSLASYRGQLCPVVQEVFATMRDCYMILDRLSDDPTNTQSPDGKPATRSYARARLARMIAADAQEFDDGDAVALAQSAADAQVSCLAAAIQQVCRAMSSPPQTVILSGHGEFLAGEALELSQIAAPTVSLAKKLGPSVSRSAPAHALAILAREIT